MRRIALFSDVHANLPALEAVLADIDAHSVTERYCLGDLVGYGPNPAGVIERIRAEAIPTIQGNYDEGVGNRRGECGCYYATEQAKADGAASYAYTDRVLGDADRSWLAALPEQLRLEIEDVSVLLVHGSPRKINEYLLPDRSDAQLARLAEDAGAQLVAVGHIHIPYHRVVSGPSGLRSHYVSSGSVGKPKDGDWRAAWVELGFGTTAEVIDAYPGDPAAGVVGIGTLAAGVRLHRVSYDVDGVAAQMLHAGLPSTLIDALRTA